METKRKGLAVLVAFAMLFFRATMGMAEHDFTVILWTEAVLAGTYLWLSLSLSQPSRAAKSKSETQSETQEGSFLV